MNDLIILTNKIKDLEKQIDNCKILFKVLVEALDGHTTGFEWLIDEFNDTFENVKAVKHEDK